MSDWDPAERDRIAGMMRNDLIKELAELDADVMYDDGHRDQEALVELFTDGQIGYRHRSTKFLRNQLYNLADVPDAERQYRNDDDRGEAFSVGRLIEELWDKDSQRTVMMRHVLNEDVTIGARVVKVEADRMYEFVNLIGPKE